MSDASPAHTPQLFPDLPTPIAEGKGRIRPRTRLLRTIGAELISSEVVAVLELVRNSYDADATAVELRFQNPEDPHRAVLEIRDNGHGMTREVLLGPWMEPATDYKKGAGDGKTGGERSPGGRRRLGSKGVGRFAAQRLGDHLELRTRATDAEHELIARFDWPQLEQKRYLDLVKIPWREGIPEHIDSYGTHLCINRLRDRWTPERFERLKLGLGRLVSPSMKEQFNIQISINGAPETIQPAIDIDTAMYSIEGSVDTNGLATISYQDINGDKETWKRAVMWPHEAEQSAGPFSFRINAWDLDREPLRHFLDLTKSPLGLRDFRRTIRDHSGISLYRDGFRILPYGEPDNDWLRLDHRRVNNPTLRLSNNQILGTIQLSADTNRQLKDQTNREGLVANQAYEHLQEVVRELLGYLETRRFAARRAMDIDWQKNSSSLPELHDDDTTSRVEGLISSLVNGSTNKKTEAEQLKMEFSNFREATADAVRHYSGLATAGQLAGLVFRQMGHPLRQVRSDLQLVLADLEYGSLNKEDLDDTLESIQRALQHLDTMEQRMEKLDPLMIGGRGRRVSTNQMNELVITVTEAFQDECYRQGVVLEVLGDASIELQTNREVAQQVLANLLDNAIHFAAQSEEDSPAVTLRITKRGFVLMDNGPGIDAAHREAIFEPHFTTREGAHGLGLTLIRDLLKTIGGRIRLTKPHPATFEVELMR